MVNVQRSALDEGGESLNVEPQAYGGRKILAHLRWDFIWSTHILIDVDTYMVSSIELRLLENMYLLALIHNISSTVVIVIFIIIDPWTGIEAWSFIHETVIF